MNKIIILFMIYSICGTILHFLFKLSKNNIAVGIFAAVNESVWEHIKILFTPIFVYSFISFLISKKPNFFILTTELVVGMSLIILFYEIKTFIFKDKKGYLNIMSFYVVCFILSIIHFKLEDIHIDSLANNLSLIPVIILLVMYLTFTIFPLKHKYFKDPITGTYGINEYVNKNV